MNSEDHPRIRGVHTGGHEVVHLVQGSSPHTRGTPALSHCTYRVPRIIPAYAGYTDSQIFRVEQEEDHPRIRGVHTHRAGQANRVPGSSPHTRGTPGRETRPGREPGIIPAYAGYTFPDAEIIFSSIGSSPHTRGTPNITYPDLQAAGIIPAYAGYTIDELEEQQKKWDHPRIRGVHFKLSSSMRQGLGSSPHTRGTPGGTLALGLYKRIIPAYAGYTWPWTAVRPTTRDHPRIRGVHKTEHTPVGSSAGSSPHTRGTPLQPWRISQGVGIIPAYAGYTNALFFYVNVIKDHPRIRGVHPPFFFFYFLKLGSSPHTRGTHPEALGKKKKTRIIPAYAGYTSPA